MEANNALAASLIKDKTTHVTSCEAAGGQLVLADYLCGVHDHVSGNQGSFAPAAPSCVANDMIGSSRPAKPVQQNIRHSRGKHQDMTAATREPMLHSACRKRTGSILG